jgi:hypothetical protein
MMLSKGSCCPANQSPNQIIYSVVWQVRSCGILDIPTLDSFTFSSNVYTNLWRAYASLSTDFFFNRFALLELNQSEQNFRAIVHILRTRACKTFSLLQVTILSFTMGMKVAAPRVISLPYCKVGTIKHISVLVLKFEESSQKLGFNG